MYKFKITFVLSSNFIFNKISLLKSSIIFTLYAILGTYNVFATLGTMLMIHGIRKFLWNLRICINGWFRYTDQSDQITFKNYPISMLTIEG